MKISIITVCKNSENLINQAIESVVNQTYLDIEYIIVDGDSQDRTKEIISHYSDSISHFISEPDDGIYAAMNKGIKLASGDFVYFLNSDDYLIDNRVIEDIVNAVKKNINCDLIYGDLDARDLNHNYVYSIIHPAPEELMERMIWGWIYHQAVFARRHLFDQFGYFSENYRISADHHWLYKVLESDAKLVYYPRKIASYWLGGISAIPSKQAAALTEIFAVQNQVKTYKSPDWIDKRILKFQSVIIELNTEVSHYRELARQLKSGDSKEQTIFQLQQEIQQLRDLLTSTQSSKFWKLRMQWFKLKGFLKKTIFYK